MVSKNDPILQVSSQEPSTSSKYEFEDGGSWLTSFQARELRLGTRVKFTDHEIYDVKNNPILQVASQEPSTSSKYDFKEEFFFQQSYSCKRAEFWHTSQELHILTIHDVKKWSYPPGIKSGTINILQVKQRGWGVLDTLLFMVENWDLAHKSRITYINDTGCQKTILFSKYPVRNHQHPPSVTLRTGGSWHISIQARELNFSTKVKNHIPWISMMSGFDPILQESNQEPLTSCKCGLGGGEDLDTFLNYAIGLRLGT